MGLEKHARMPEDAEVQILEEAVLTSYEKGGKAVRISSEEVSRETVKNKLHGLKFPKKETEQELIKIICHGTKKKFEKKIEELKKEITYPSGRKRIEEGKAYFKYTERIIFGGKSTLLIPTITLHYPYF